MLFIPVTHVALSCISALYTFGTYLNSNRLLGRISDQLTNKYYDFEFMMFYLFKNSVMYIYCHDYTKF